jgi:hypothetical protein
MLVRELSGVNEPISLKLYTTTYLLLYVMLASSVSPLNVVSALLSCMSD